MNVEGNRTVNANLCNDCRQSFFVTLRDSETFRNDYCTTYLTDHDQIKLLDTGKMKAFWIVLLLGLVSKNGSLIHGLHKMVPIARKITFSGRSESLIRHFERSV